MKYLILSLFLFCGAAQAQPQPEAPVQQPPAPALSSPGGKYYAEIMDTMKNLSLLIAKGAEIPPQKMEALAPQLSAFNGKVKDALGSKILAEVARQEKEADEKARAEAAGRTLQAFRGTLQLAYTEAGGKYPKDPAELAPRLMQAVPELHLPGHEITARIKIVDSKKYDQDMAKAVGDSGGWLYFSNPESLNYGLLVLDCSHAAQDGTKFFEY